MKTLFSVPIYDEYGNTNLNFEILLSALQNHADNLTVRTKDDPENEQLSEELAATLILQMDLTLLEANAFLDQPELKSSQVVNHLTHIGKSQSN